MNNNWIPVTERLPEKKGLYLCTIFDGFVYGGANMYVNICEYGDKIAPGATRQECILPNGWAFGEEWPDGMDNLENVIAWMSLPEPYKWDRE